MTRNKAVVGFENYIIYEDGRVFSVKNNKFLSLRERGQKRRKYKTVALYDGTGKAIAKSVHTLVATAFIPNPSNKPIVNHKDNNPSNNHVDNLEWVTYSENTIHSYRQTDRSRGFKKVLQIDKDSEEIIMEFDSLISASAYIGVHYSNISKVLNGKQKSAGGYGWKYNI